MIVATLALLASERDELTHVAILSERSTQGYQGSAARVNAGPDGPRGANVTPRRSRRRSIADPGGRAKRGGRGAGGTRPTRRQDLLEDLLPPRPVEQRPGGMLARVTAPPEETSLLGAAAEDLVLDPQALVAVAGDLDEIRCPGTLGAAQKTRG